MEFKSSRTWQNILYAYANESKARSSYTMYAEVARAEGREDIAQLFERMGKNEQEHAKLWYKILNDGIGDSATNLAKSAKEENAEWKNLYPRFAEEARAEGYDSVATMFEQIAAIEYDHERRFMESYLHLQNKDSVAEVLPPCTETQYCCIFCGHQEAERVTTCPVCGASNSLVK